MQVSAPSCHNVHRQGRLLLAQPLVMQVSVAACVQCALLHAALHDAFGLLVADADGNTAAAAARRAPQVGAPRSQAPRCEAPCFPELSALLSPATAHKLHGALRRVPVFRDACKARSRIGRISIYGGRGSCGAYHPHSGDPAFVGVTTCLGRLDTVVKYLDSNSAALRSAASCNLHSRATAGVSAS